MVLKFKDGSQKNRRYLANLTNEAGAIYNLQVGSPSVAKKRGQLNPQDTLWLAGALHLNIFN